MALTTLPYLVWLAVGRADLQHLGSFWFSRDFSQYLAAMNTGFRSEGLLLYNHFTAEPHAPILMYPLYVALGRLAAVLGTGVLHIYYAAEVVSRVVLILALYQFAALFALQQEVRRLAFLLAACTLGLAALAVPLRTALESLGGYGLAAYLPEKVNPYLEVNSFGVFFSAPHLMLGLALTLLIPRPYLAIADQGIRFSRAAVLSLLCVALAWIHSFNLPVVLCVLGAHSAILAVRQRRLAPLAATMAAGLACLPPLLYSAAMFQLDPFWSQTYGRQNAMPSPSLAALPVDFGLVLLLAPLGWWLLRKKPGSSSLLLLLWCALGLIWMYAPVPFQRRFGFGLQPGLSVLAAFGLFYLLERTRNRPSAKRLLSYSALLLGVSTTVLVYMALLFSAATNMPAKVYAWTQADARAAAWLAANSDAADVVLAESDSSNTIAGIIPGRVVFGHVVATLRAEEKEALQGRFFDPGTSTEERRDLLRESRATLVYFGPAEREAGAPPPDHLPELILAYDRDGVRIYRVVAGPDSHG